ncbi:MAG TPA: ribonuclease P protein component 4 [Candidatus Nanoarchaeia archaeon]|nr:ribonuclease P protein component 4 [Candidatus Nanoarchaeia archaeon]
MPKPLFSKTQQRHIAQERIKKLFQQADEMFSSHPELSNRYVTLARKIAMKARTPIPRELKRKFCKHCLTYLRPGANTRVRTRQGKVVISCLVCKKMVKIPMGKKEQKK